MKVIIAGERDYIPSWNSTVWLIKKLTELNADLIISGGCPGITYDDGYHAEGADQFGIRIAKCMGIEYKIYRALWNKYGNAAGPIRNSIMAKSGDVCILFSGGKNTANMKMYAKDNKVKIYEYGDENELRLQS